MLGSAQTRQGFALDPAGALPLHPTAVAVKSCALVGTGFAASSGRFASSGSPHKIFDFAGTPYWGGPKLSCS